MPPPFSVCVGGRGLGAYSITTVRTYIRPVPSHPSHPVRPVCNTFGFRAISFERIGELD